ncbi:MAG: cupredoxin domain-containing protein [Gaiellaceae bacterium]
MRRLLILLGAVAVLSAAAPAGAATVTVRIVKSGFTPTLVTINADDSVTWTNRDTVNHQVVSDSGSFVSPILRPGQSYSFTFKEAGTFRYRDALEPAERATITVKGPPPSVSIGLSVPMLVFGGETHLQGVVSSKKAGESVTLLANAYGQGSYSQLAIVITSTGGTFDFVVKPTILTSYLAQYKGVPSQEVLVQVRPKITLQPRGRRSFLTRVSAGRSFAGRSVYLQRRSPFGQWVTIQKYTLGRLSGKLFRVPNRRGTSHYRIFMTVNQAGVGYLESWSGTQTVRRR